MIIAITGTIGSGKSYVSNIIKSSYNYDLFSCDEIVLNAYNDNTIKAKLLEEFKTSNKNEIKHLINDENVKKLNAIIHPYVKDYILEIANKFDKNLVFVEVPLLFESNMENLFDKVIVVTSNFLLRRFRILKRNKKDYKSMIKLEKYQLSSKIKKAKSDYVIKNNISRNSLNKQILKIINDLKKEN